MTSQFDRGLLKVAKDNLSKLHGLRIIGREYIDAHEVKGHRFYRLNLELFHLPVAISSKRSTYY